MRNLGIVLVAIGLLAPATAAAGVNVDYVARAGDDSTTEHVTVVRSRNAITGFTTTVSYEKGALLDEREGGYTVELTTGFGFVPAWSFLGLPRFAVLSINAAQIDAMVYVLDCDLEGFCDQVSASMTRSTPPSRSGSVCSPGERSIWRSLCSKSKRRRHWWRFGRSRHWQSPRQ